MTEERLAVIKERAEKATDGPWEWRTDFLDCEELYSWNDDDVLTAGCGQNVGFVKVSEANAEFIANARQDVPKLVAEVERLQNKLALYKLGKRNSDAMIAYKDEEIARLRKSLEFYADRDAWLFHVADYDVYDDGGMTAREALK